MSKLAYEQLAKLTAGEAINVVEDCLSAMNFKPNIRERGVILRVLENVASDLPDLGLSADLAVSKICSALKIMNGPFWLHVCQSATRKALDPTSDTLSFYFILRNIGMVGLKLPPVALERVEAVLLQTLDRMPPIALAGLPTTLHKHGSRSKPLYAELEKSIFGIEPRLTARMVGNLGWALSHVPDFGLDPKFLELVNRAGDTTADSLSLRDLGFVAYGLTSRGNISPELLKRLHGRAMLMIAKCSYVDFHYLTRTFAITDPLLAKSLMSAYQAKGGNHTREGLDHMSDIAVVDET